MSATDELLPCPFCGGEVSLEEFDHLNMSHGEYVHEWAFWHHCPPMGKHRNVYGMGDGAITIESAYFETREDAIAAWNRRATLGATDARPTQAESSGTCPMTDGPWGYPFRCSECGAQYDADIKDGELRFCPNCGAKVVDDALDC